MATIIEKILNEVCVDNRIIDGMFDVFNDTHMEVLREYLINKGLPRKDVYEYSNLVLEGKYPERQAYNKDGLLVTFPTPDYKKRAIERGTHFEKNPVSGGQPSPAPTPQQPASPASPQTNSNPVKSQSPPVSIPVDKSAEKSALPSSNAAASDNASKTPAQPVDSPQPQPQPPTQATPDSHSTPPPATPETQPLTDPKAIQANKEAIKQLLNTDELMLEEVIKFITTEKFDKLKPYIQFYS